MVIFSAFLLDWCSSSTSSLNNTNSYIIDDQSVVPLFIVFCLISITGLLFHFRLTEKVTRSLTDGYNLHFAEGLFSLITLAIFSFGNQSVSSLTCRPVEMLNDSGYMLILGIQLLGFLTSLLGAYGLGSVFARFFDQNKLHSASNRNHTVCVRSVKRLTSHRLPS